MIGHLPVPRWARTRLAATARPKWHRIVGTAPADVLGGVVAVTACGLTSGPLGVARAAGGGVVAGHWELGFGQRDPDSVHVCFRCGTAVRAGRAA